MNKNDPAVKSLMKYNKFRLKEIALHQDIETENLNKIDIAIRIAEFNEKQFVRNWEAIVGKKLK